MALIYFYDVTEIDKKQLAAELQFTDHRWEFIEDQISEDNLNPEAEVISVFVSSTVSASIIQKLPKLRLIACRSTGFNNVDLTAAAAKDITVTNVPSYGEKTVAEYAFALILSLTRKIITASTHVSTEDQPIMMGSDLNQKTLGVIGAGRIGSNVIRIAKGFSMNVVGYDPYPKEGLDQELGFTFVSLDELLQQSDIITVHVPFMGTNRHLIGADQFSAMKDGVTFINTSRGELVDTSALINALQSGKVLQAALDVIEDEHIMSLHGELELIQGKSSSREQYLHSLELLALQKMPNVLLTPHNAFNTLEALGRINQTTIDNIVKYWFGNVPNKVQATKQMGTLLIARHTESEWNALGKWTGTTDVHLSEKGFHEAAMLGQILPSMPIAMAYTSQQIRTLETVSGILDASQNFEVPIERIGALNERDYGEYTGKNKWEVKAQMGQEAFDCLRRDWDYKVLGGETLKDVYERVLPFYIDVVLPQLQAGKNIMLVAHGNSIRALMHYLESVPEDKMADVEMLFNTIVSYTLDNDGKMITKTEYKTDSPKPPA